MKIGLQPRCAECGGYHFGTYGCVYKEVLSDPSSTPAQRENAADHIRAHRESQEVVKEKP